MTAKELERLIAERGGNASALDKVTRALRAASKEPFAIETAGRGPNAHQLTRGEKAFILIAYAGAEVATQAVSALLSRFHLSADPIELHGGRLNGILGVDLQEMLGNPLLLPQIERVRIGKNQPIAIVELIDGRRAIYSPKKQPDLASVALSGFLSEGVLSRELLQEAASR